jgi:hypothetical protein
MICRHSFTTNFNLIGVRFGVRARRVKGCGDREMRAIRFVTSILRILACSVHACSRGEAENWIKEQQLDLFGTRCSAHRFVANQSRNLLQALTYTRWKAIRRLGLQGRERARARFCALRLKLIKIGAVVLTDIRCVRLLCSAHAPVQTLWRLGSARLMAAPG